MLTGISTMVDHDVPLQRLAELIAAAGFDCLSLGHVVDYSGYHNAAGRAEIRKLLQRVGLKLDYIHPPIQPYYDLTSLDEHVRALSVAMHSFVLESCAELGGRAITAHACNEKHFNPAELEQRCSAGLRSLDELAGVAERTGVHLCIENLPCTYSAQDVTALLLKRCDNPHVYVTLDPNHAYIDCADPKALIEQLAPRVRSTHVSDTMGHDDSHLLPGEGIVDFAHMAAALGRAGFSEARGDVLDLEVSINMQRRRVESGKLHAGDPGHGDMPMRELPGIEEYLKRAYTQARRIADQVEAAKGMAA